VLWLTILSPLVPKSPSRLLEDPSIEVWWGQHERRQARDIVDLDVQVEVIIDVELGDGADVLVVDEKCEEEELGDQSARKVETEFRRARGLGMTVDQRATPGCSWCWPELLLIL
jgi:hypothetical protein